MSSRLETCIIMSAEDNLDNLAQQNDEIEALSSIYEDGWEIVNDLSHSYRITVHGNPEQPQWTVTFQFQFPEGYPSMDPPQYQIIAPWLGGVERKQLDSDLADIYCENIGQTIIFLWVEKIREFLKKKSEKDAQVKKCHEELEEKADHALASQTAELDISKSPEALEDAEEFDPSRVVKYAGPVPEETGEAEEVTACPEIFHGEPLYDRKSTFQPHLAAVHSVKEVDMVMKTLLENKKIAMATHNIIAYRITKPNSSIVIQNCADDGEFTAGSRILHLLQILKAENVLVVVTRWYGGIHLGNDRFKHINNCARDILEEHGYIKPKEDKKGSKKGRKSR